MTYRILPTSEWERLRPLVEKYGHPLPPNPDQCLGMTAAAVAEDSGGTIKGVWFIQLAFHVEPLILEDPHVNFMRLFKTLTQPLEDKHGLTYYGFTDREVTEGMAKHLGFEQMPYKIWKQEVK